MLRREFHCRRSRADCEQFALGAVEASFIGPILAADLCRRSGVPAPPSCTLALTHDLSEIAKQGSPGAVAFDAASVSSAVYLTGAGDKYGVSLAPIAASACRVDLTRPLAALSTGDSQELPDAAVSAEDLALWRAFAHVVLAADLLGSARAAYQTTADYATGRTQYGRSIASFQAVQHMLAESLVVIEGAQKCGQLRGLGDRRRTRRERHRDCAGRQGVLHARRENRVRDGNPGPWRYREHLGVHGAHSPAARSRRRRDCRNDGALMEELIDRRLRAS